MHRLLLLVPILVSLAGCSRSPDVQSSVSNLEKSFAAAPDSPALKLAVAAVRTNEPGLGVVALHEAKRMPGLSAEQLQAVEQASQAIVSDLVRRAAEGDARAKAQLELIERSRSQ